jgi:abequosyltransferase
MALSIEFAQGEYCWLFSADDIMETDALSRVKREIASQRDVYLLGFSIYSKDMSTFKQNHPILDADIPTDFNLSNQVERLRFFESSLTTSAFFSFISSLVINKSCWESHPPIKTFYGSCWAHVARLFSAIPQELTVRYLPDSFLKKRSDNDSFMDKGFIHRMAISIEGFHNLANEFFGDNTKEAYHIRRTVRNEIPLRNIIKAHLEAKSIKEKQRLSELIKLLYIDKRLSLFFLKIAYKSTPQPFFDFSKRLYKFFRNRP